MQVQPLNTAIGARITGVDLRAVDDATFAALHDALSEHLVVFLPAQELTDADQLALIRRFGDDYVHPIARASGITESTVGHIVDDQEHPPFQDEWHTDVSWDPAPPTYGMLRAIEMPERGGDTIWASTYAAYDALSPTMQAMLDGLVAFHDMGRGTAFLTKSGEDLVRKAAELCPGAEHPVVRTHPATGRRHLYVNRGFTRRIVGLHPAESDALLDLLFRHCEHPGFQVRYEWAEGDVAIWDERPTLHFAVADHFPQRREMARTNAA
ncbi:MAG: TauD/TfdA family dioxygenase [Acidimicrobiia bacterium]|jgi:taurine dioxygenase